MVAATAPPQSTRESIMSIRTADEALDFLPVVNTGKAKGVLAMVATVISAIAEGQRAAAEFDRLTAHGMGQSDAARTVFERHFKSR